MGKDKHRMDNVKIVGIEDQIRALEQLLNNDDDSDRNDSDIDIDIENHDNTVIELNSNDIENNNDSVLIKRDALTGEVIGYTSSLSANTDYRIPKLPKRMLPNIIKSSNITDNSNKKRTFDSSNNTNNGSIKKRTVRFQSDDAVPLTNANDGLEKTIREMLNNYKPSSWEKKPFWCRICQHQAVDINDFEAHRTSKEHALAVNIERKMTYCKLCKLQFTSMDQMKEHLKAKKHNDTLAYMKSKTQRRKFC